MAFNRKDFYDSIFYWYAIDVTDAIAEFISVYSPIPKVVFTEENVHIQIENYFENLSQTTKEHLSDKGLEISKISVNNLINQRIAARKGLYSFCEIDPGTEFQTECYELLSLPDEQMKFGDLPKEIQKSLAKLRFTNIEFKKTEKINITDFFECDLDFHCK